MEDENPVSTNTRAFRASRTPKATVTEAIRLGHRGELTLEPRTPRSASARSFFTYASKPQLVGGDSRLTGFLGDIVVAPFKNCHTTHRVDECITT